MTVETTIDSMSAYVEEVGARARHWSGHYIVFRGVADIEHHRLIPSIGRTPPARPYGQLATPDGAERQALEIFETRCVAHLAQRPANRLEVLLHAQHHGLPTRLMDWTFSPLVALYFAVASEPVTADGAVYVANHGSPLQRAPNRSEVEADPLNIDKNYFIVPPYINRRLAAQQSCFTLHSEPSTPYSHSHKAIRIPKEAKMVLRDKLDQMGVSAETIFPDLEGLARWIAYHVWMPGARYVLPAALDGIPINQAGDGTVRSS